jgi:hypothetical protein
MNNSKGGKTAAENLETFLATLPRPGQELTVAAVEEGQRSKQALLDGGAASVPILLNRLADPDFIVKDTCYDLVLQIGEPAKEVPYREFKKRGPIVDIWIDGILQQLGDKGGMDRIRPYLHDRVDYVRHLTALALAFENLDSPNDAKEFVSVLVDALQDERSIEGTPFTVAGSALACLTRITRQIFFLHPARSNSTTTSTFFTRLRYIPFRLRQTTSRRPGKRKNGISVAELKPGWLVRQLRLLLR